MFFGAQGTSHLLRQTFRDGVWSAPRVEPWSDLVLAPQTRALHYAQSVFEGFKAHRLADGGVALFRPRAHLERLRRSLARMCLPDVDVETLLAGIVALVARDRAAVPDPPAALYVRPLVFADDPDLLAWPGQQATLLVLCSAVPPYFDQARGLRLRTELEHVRAFPGGTGSIKAAGNYAAAMLAQRTARAEGYDEVVWLDAVERGFVEETGSMNLFLVRAGELWTPPAGDTVLPGITRASLAILAAEQGLVVREERVPLERSWWKSVSEVFSAGTAVGCAPIASIDHAGEPWWRASGEAEIQPRLMRALFDLKEGRAADERGWRVPC